MAGLDRFEDLVGGNWAPESHNTLLETDMVARLLSTVWATKMRLVELGLDKVSSSAPSASNLRRMRKEEIAN